MTQHAHISDELLATLPLASTESMARGMLEKRRVVTALRACELDVIKAHIVATNAADIIDDQTGELFSLFDIANSHVIYTSYSLPQQQAFQQLAAWLLAEANVSLLSKTFDDLLNCFIFRDLHNYAEELAAADLQKRLLEFLAAIFEKCPISIQKPLGDRLLFRIRDYVSDLFYDHENFLYADAFLPVVAPYFLGVSSFSPLYSELINASSAEAMKQLLQERSAEPAALQLLKSPKQLLQEINGLTQCRTLEILQWLCASAIPRQDWEPFLTSGFLRTAIRSGLQPSVEDARKLMKQDDATAPSIRRRQL